MEVWTDFWVLQQSSVYQWPRNIRFSYLTFSGTTMGQMSVAGPRRLASLIKKVAGTNRPFMDHLAFWAPIKAKADASRDLQWGRNI